MDAIREFDAGSVDPELRCRFVIAAARLARDGGDPAAAVAPGVNAVLRAYVFHVERDRAEAAPTVYTRSLHEESLFQLSDTLTQVHQEPEQWITAAGQVVDYFTPWWRDASADRPAVPDADELAALGPEDLLRGYVPQPPGDQDLNRKVGPFADWARQVKGLTGPVLSWPPQSEG